MTMLSLFDPPPREWFCVTCGGPLERRPPYSPPVRFCSYWCHLVENGPDFYTLERITPWLDMNRRRKIR